MRTLSYSTNLRVAQYVGYVPVTHLTVDQLSEMSCSSNVMMELHGKCIQSPGNTHGIVRPSCCNS